MKSPDEVSNAVIKKALTDPKFKAALLANPNAAVEKATGVKVPDGIVLKVVEDTASTVHLVLPCLVEKGKLSEAELSKIAGGVNGVYTQFAYDACGSGGKTNICTATAPVIPKK